MKIKRIITVSTLLILSTASMFVPIKLTMARERHIQINSNNSEPITGAKVRQIWHQYSLEVRGQDDFIVPTNGKILLPARVVRTNAASLLIGALNKFKKYGLHASYRSSESIGMTATGHKDKWFHDGKGLNDGIVTLTPKDK